MVKSSTSKKGPKIYSTFSALRPQSNYNRCDLLRRDHYFDRNTNFKISKKGRNTNIYKENEIIWTKLNHNLVCYVLSPQKKLRNLYN